MEEKMVRIDVQTPDGKRWGIVVKASVWDRFERVAGRLRMSWKQAAERGVELLEDEADRDQRERAEPNVVPRMDF